MLGSVVRGAHPSPATRSSQVREGPRPGLSAWLTPRSLLSQPGRTSEEASGPRLILCTVAVPSVFLSLPVSPSQGSSRGTGTVPSRSPRHTQDLQPCPARTHGNRLRPRPGFRGLESHGNCLGHAPRGHRRYGSSIFSSRFKPSVTPEKQTKPALSPLGYAGNTSERFAHPPTVSLGSERHPTCAKGWGGVLKKKHPI